MPSRSRFARAAALLVGATSLSVVALTAPVAAQDTFEEPHPIGKTSLVVSSVSGGFSVCYSGTAWAPSRVAGVWEVVMGGTSLTMPVTVIETGTSISGCALFSKSLLAGEIVITFTYHAAGTTIGTSVIAGSVGSATWAPLIGNWPVSVDLNQP